MTRPASAAGGVRTAPGDMEAELALVPREADLSYAVEPACRWAERPRVSCVAGESRGELAPCPACPACASSVFGYSYELRIPPIPVAGEGL